VINRLYNALGALERALTVIAVVFLFVIMVLVVADGAGGLKGGAEAASIAVELVRQQAGLLSDSSACAALLHAVDGERAPQQHCLLRCRCGPN